MVQNEQEQMHTNFTNLDSKWHNAIVTGSNIRTQSFLSWKKNSKRKVKVNVAIVGWFPVWNALSHQLVSGRPKDFYYTHSVSIVEIFGKTIRKHVFEARDQPRLMAWVPDRAGTS